MGISRASSKAGSAGEHQKGTGLEVSRLGLELSHPGVHVPEVPVEISLVRRSGTPSSGDSQETSAMPYEESVTSAVSAKTSHFMF